MRTSRIRMIGVDTRVSVVLRFASIASRANPRFSGLRNGIMVCMAAGRSIGMLRILHDHDRGKRVVAHRMGFQANASDTAGALE